VLNEFAACFLLSLTSLTNSVGGWQWPWPPHDSIFFTKTFEIRRTLLHVLIFSPSNNFASTPNLAILGLSL
jgi:hypothetical protein